MRIGIDLGGTKIEAVCLDDTGKENFRKRVPTPQGDYSGTVKALVELCRAADPTRKATIGIGTPGAISPLTGRIKNSNSTCLIDQPLDQDLEKELARPVRLANDADCFTLSEAVDGAAKNDKTVFGVILGTGVGGGFVIDKTLLTGPNAIAGEWGHNPLPWTKDDECPGPACYCGLSGCIETFLSGPGLERSFAERFGKSIQGRELLAQPEAEVFLPIYFNQLARALAHVINIFDPYAIVLGGGVSNIDAIYKEVPKLWGDYVFSDNVETKLLKNKHGDSSGVRGAAWLWPN